MCFEFFRYKYEDSRWFHENVSKMTAHFNGRNETEALLRFCLIEFFVRKALYFKYKPYFPCEMAEDSPAVRWALFTCVSLFFFSPFAGLQSCIEKLNIVGTTSFFSTS